MRQIAGGVELSLPDCAQMIESTCALMTRPGYVSSVISGFVARLDLVQLVLTEQREDLVLVVDERHDLVERHAGDEEAGTQHAR